MAAHAHTAMQPTLTDSCVIGVTYLDLNALSHGDYGRARRANRGFSRTRESVTSLLAGDRLGFRADSSTWDPGHPSNRVANATGAPK